MDIAVIHPEYETVRELLKRSDVSEVLEWTFKYDSISKSDGLPYNTTFFESI